MRIRQLPVAVAREQWREVPVNTPGMQVLFSELWSSSTGITRQRSTLAKMCTRLSTDAQARHELNFDSPGNEARTRREIDCKSSAPRLRLWSSLAPPCPALHCWMALPDIVREIAIVLCSLGAVTKHFVQRKFGIFINSKAMKIATFFSLQIYSLKPFSMLWEQLNFFKYLFSILKYIIIPLLHLTFIKYYI